MTWGMEPNCRRERAGWHQWWKTLVGEIRGRWCEGVEVGRRDEIVWRMGRKAKATKNTPSFIALRNPQPMRTLSQTRLRTQPIKHSLGQPIRVHPSNTARHRSIECSIAFFI
jgi:hypothetical protein